METYKEFKGFSRLLADKSSKIISQYFRSGIGVEVKKDQSPVTIADKKAEEVMRELIMNHYPEHGIIGEEFGRHNESSDFVWILDPIDGTKSFISGAQTFGTLIGLTYKGLPVLGVINQPILKEFMIGDNNLTLLNDSKVEIRECLKPEDALLLTTDHLQVLHYHHAEKYESFIRRVKLYRNWGDCYGYHLLAAGFADIMIDPIMNIWDMTALIPVVRGAGGVITDYQGNEPLLGNSIVAANPRLHPIVITALN